MLVKLILSLLVFVISNAEKVRYDGYTVYKVYPKEEAQIKLLQNLMDDKELDFWTEPSPALDFVSIMASPTKKGELQRIFTENYMVPEVQLADVQAIIDKETVRKYTRNVRNSMTWTAYYSLNDTNAWLDDLVATYSDVASIIIGGSSYEGRDIKGIKISHGPGRRAIFIEGGIHSREWISPAVVNFITNELLTSSDPETVAAAREFDWYIFPITNPDGYVWTFIEERLWRKNRRPVGTEYGIDLNRNWDSNWMVVGASSNPVSNNYAGTAPFSEPEARTLADYITSLAPDIDMYLSFHSSGQLMMVPFGNTTTALSNYNETVNIGRRAMGALSVRYGTQYTTGNIAEAIYLAAGTSVDWVKEALDIRLVYCYELRDRGFYGHLLPADQILPSGQETMDSVLDLIHQAKRFGAFPSSAIRSAASFSAMMIAFALFTILMV